MARSVAAVTDARNMSMELTKLVDIVTSWIFFMLILNKFLNLFWIKSCNYPFYFIRNIYLIYR